MKLIPPILNLLLGASFVISAITKFISIDSFELFLFDQFGIDLIISSILSRMIIIFELILGIFICLKLSIIVSYKIALITLILFSVYLCTLIFSETPPSNCHCYGDTFELSPLSSIFKNIFSIILVSILLFNKEKIKRKRRIFQIAVFTLAIALPFILSPPDFIVSSRHSTEEIQSIDVNKEILRNFISKDSIIQIEENNYLLCFFTTKCRFCQLTARKVSLFNKKIENKIPTYYVFGDQHNALEEFWQKSESEKYPYLVLPMIQFFQASQPKIPVVYFVKNNKIVKKASFRSLNEEEMNSFYN